MSETTTKVQRPKSIEAWRALTPAEKAALTEACNAEREAECHDGTYIVKPTQEVPEIDSKKLRELNLDRVTGGDSELTPHEYIVGLFEDVSGAVEELTYAVLDDGFDIVPIDYVHTVLQALAVMPGAVPDYHADVAGFMRGESGELPLRKLERLPEVEAKARRNRCRALFRDIGYVAAKAADQLTDGEFAGVVQPGYLKWFLAQLAVDPTFTPDFKTVCDMSIEVAEGIE